MRDLATIDPEVGASRTVVSTPGLAYDLWKEPQLPWVPRPGLRRGIFPTIALSFFLSTASVLNDPRTVFAADSSVLLASMRRTRRISLAEARRIALDTVCRAEERARIAAEREAADFMTLFGWNPE